MTLSEVHCKQRRLKNRFWAGDKKLGAILNRLQPRCNFSNKLTLILAQSCKLEVLQQKAYKCKKSNLGAEIATFKSDAYTFKPTICSDRGSTLLKSIIWISNKKIITWWELRSNWDKTKQTSPNLMKNSLFRFFSDVMIQLYTLGLNQLMLGEWQYYSKNDNLFIAIYL